MAYSFPPNPTLNQTYSSNGRTFRWDGVTWTATAVPTQTTAPVYISVSPPPNPIQGSLWYNSNTAFLNVWYTDLNGGAWVSVVPFPQDTITQQGGIFEGAIYAQYDIPTAPAAFVTVDWVQKYLTAFLSTNGYMRSGNGVVIDSNSQITSISSALVV